MGRDREEPNRVLGFPVPRARGHASGRAAEPAPSGGQGEESQRILGFPVDWLRPDGRSVLARLTDPVRAYWRRTRQRQHP